MPNFFDKKKLCDSLWKLASLLKIKIDATKIHRGLKFNQSQWLKQYVDFNIQNRIEAEKNSDKDGKALYELMNNAVYGKTMENLRNRIYVKLVSNKNGYLKWTPKPRYMSHKRFDNDLVAIQKNKVKT